MRRRWSEMVLAAAVIGFQTLCGLRADDSPQLRGTEKLVCASLAASP